MDEEEKRHDVIHTSAAATNNGMDLLYGVQDAPPWYLAILLGLQHFLLMVGSVIFFPILLSRAMCVTDDVVTAQLIGTIAFVSGIVTVLQVMLGSRLPVVQGPSAAYLAPTFAILNLPQFKCQGPGTLPAASGGVNDSLAMTSLAPTAENITDATGDDWTLRMNEIQGAIITASFFEMAFGLFGLVGILLRFLGPLSVAPTVALIGISLFVPAYNYSSDNWWVAAMTAALITLFSQYLRNVEIPCGSKKSFPLFKLFPAILGILTSWLICYVLTITDAIPEDSWGSGARTDIREAVLNDAGWFRFPYPGQWGMPTFSVAGTFAMLAGAMASTVESVGDYFACARLSGAPPPPVHAVNRGIFVEGLGCLLSGLWGTGTGCTSYSQNSAAIGITKVGSRRMILWTGFILLLCGVVTKFGALFVSIPDPIIGGVFIVTFGMMTSVGISQLQFVDLNSSRNLFVFGVSLFVGIMLSQWMSAHGGAINTGSDVIDQIFRVLLSTSMFVGGFLAFILDNTIPGTDEERGIKKWRDVVSQVESEESRNVMKVYDLPFFNDFFTRKQWSRYFPLCPSFDDSCGCKQKTDDDEEDVIEVKYNGGEDVMVVNEKGREASVETKNKGREDVITKAT